MSKKITNLKIMKKLPSKKVLISTITAGVMLLSFNASQKTNAEEINTENSQISVTTKYSDNILKELLKNYESLKKYDFIDNKFTKIKDHILLKVGKKDPDSMNYGYIDPFTLEEKINIGEYDFLEEEPLTNNIVGKKVEADSMKITYLDSNTLQKTDAIKNESLAKYYDGSLSSLYINKLNRIQIKNQKWQENMENNLKNIEKMLPDYAIKELHEELNKRAILHETYDDLGETFKCGANNYIFYWSEKHKSPGVIDLDTFEIKLPSDLYNIPEMPLNERLERQISNKYLVYDINGESIARIKTENNNHFYFGYWSLTDKKPIIFPGKYNYVSTPIKINTDYYCILESKEAEVFGLYNLATKTFALPLEYSSISFDNEKETITLIKDYETIDIKFYEINEFKVTDLSENTYNLALKKN